MRYASGYAKPPSLQPSVRLLLRYWMRSMRSTKHEEVQHPIVGLGSAESGRGAILQSPSARRVQGAGSTPKLADEFELK